MQARELSRLEEYTKERLCEPRDAEGAALGRQPTGGFSPGGIFSPDVPERIVSVGL